MTKTIEEELGLHFGRLDKALDGLVKSHAKFIHGMSPDQRAAVVAHLRAKASDAEVKLNLATSSASGFSFSQPIVAAPSPQPAQPQAPAAPVYVQPPAQGVLPANNTAGAPWPVSALAPPRPVGRIARNSTDPDAGKVLIAPPIAASRPTAPVGVDGCGFLAKDSKSAEIEV